MKKVGLGEKEEVIFLNIQTDTHAG